MAAAVEEATTSLPIQSAGSCDVKTSSNKIDPGSCDAQPSGMCIHKWHEKNGLAYVHKIHLFIL